MAHHLPQVLGDGPQQNTVHTKQVRDSEADIEAHILIANRIWRPLLHNWQAAGDRPANQTRPQERHRGADVPESEAAKESPPKVQPSLV